LRFVVSLVREAEPGHPATRLHFSHFFFSQILVLFFFGIIVVACIAPFATYAIGGFTDFLFRSHLIAFIGNGHGVHNFGILTFGIAIDILRSDLEGVKEQAAVGGSAKLWRGSGCISSQ
jgi:hypothetical protein